MTIAYIFFGVLALLCAIKIFIIRCEQEIIDEQTRGFYDPKDDEEFIC